MRVIGDVSTTMVVFVLFNPSSTSGLFEQYHGIFVKNIDIFSGSSRLFLDNIAELLTKNMVKFLKIKIASKCHKTCKYDEIRELKFPFFLTGKSKNT